ncbi:MAG: SH3 domain-containing protein [Tyzzerella sp.]|nr:SH3 domain-containing protein [Tyzzerella sp.]
MELYHKSRFFRRRNDNKMLIIIAIAVAVILTAVAIVVAITLGKDKTHSKEVYDTNLTGDATVDPENVEAEEEEGTNVDAEELTEESGRSNGIDVSKWQGKIDWQKVKDSGIEFAFIRIGYRGENGTIYKDDNADYNIQQAQKAGVLVGVYFFSTAINETEAREEAEWTMQAIKGYKISYPVVYDCEGYKISTSRMFGLTSEERTDNAMMFLKTISDAGYDAMFYGALSEINDETYWDISQIEKKYKVWVAHYSTVAYPDKEKPDYANRCHAWQYTNKGSVSGISGNVDMVVCYFTKEEARAKDASAAPETAKAPLTDEEKLYTTVNEQVTAKDVTNLRDDATTKSNIVVALKNGEVVTRIGVGKNGWSKLQYNGKTVYAISSYLTTDLTRKEPEKAPEKVPVKEKDIVAGHTFTPKNDKVTAKEFVNLRALPTTDSEKVGTLNSGEFLERTAVSDKGWSRLIYNGQAVYAVTSYLSNEVVALKDPTPPTNDDGFTAVDEQVTAKEETNLRTKPATEGSDVVYTLKHGEYVQRIGVHTNGWSKLEYNGQIVYAITSYLTKGE